MTFMEQARGAIRRWLGGGMFRPQQMQPIDRFREWVPIRLPASLGIMPYVDEETGETQEIRDQYRSMLKDAVVQSGLDQTVGSVASLDPSCIPGDSSPRGDEKATFCLYALQQVAGGLPDMIMRLGTHAWIDGTVIAEKSYKLAERGRWRGRHVLRSITPKDRCELVQDEFGNIIGVRSIINNTVYPPWKFLIYRRTPLFAGPGRSAFRSAYRAYWIKATAHQIWLNGMERDVEGLLKGEYDPADKNGSADMERALQQAKGGTYIVVPKGAMVEAINLNRRMASDFKDACDYQDKQITLALTGAVLQSLDGGAQGSFAKAKVHAGTASIMQWKFSADVCQMVNEQIIPDLMSLNYADDWQEYPSFALSAVDVEEMSRQADLDLKLVSMGLPLSKDQMYRTYSRERPKDDADALTPPQPSNMPVTGPLPFASKEAGGTERALPFADDAAIALPASDRRGPELLLAAVQEKGIRLLQRLARKATQRLVDEPNPDIATTFFSADELAQLAASLADAMAPAYLLGAARIADRAEKARNRHRNDATPPATRFPGPTTSQLLQFTDAAGTLTYEPVPPTQALDYFQSLYPSLNHIDPLRFGELLRRQAFTLAVVTERTLLQSVQLSITTSIAQGQTLMQATASIQKLLDDAGVTPANPQYAEMVYRTNTMDAYNVGAQEELQREAETFPVWRYANAQLDTSRKTHRERHGNYYAASTPFTLVRGESIADAANCTCTMIPIDRWEWEQLQAEGATLSG